MQPEKQGEQNYWQPAQGTVSGQVSDAAPTPPPPSSPAPVPSPTAPPAGEAPVPPVNPENSTAATPPPSAAAPQATIPTAGPVGPLGSTDFAPPPPPPVTPPQETISWSASEFIQHDKTLLWFIILGAIGVGLLAASILLLKDWFFAVIVVVLLVGVGIVAARKPRTLKYAISEDGIHVGETVHPYQKFHAFSLVNEDETWSIILMPNARFSPTLTLYFAKDQGEDIVDALNNYLPMEEHKVDFVDRISRKIRF